MTDLKTYKDEATQAARNRCNIVMFQSKDIASAMLTLATRKNDLYRRLPEAMIRKEREYIIEEIEEIELRLSEYQENKKIMSKKPKDGLPRFLFCSNPLVNDLEFIMHTSNPRCLLKVIREGKIKAQVMQLFDEATREQLAELEEEAAIKYFYYQKTLQKH